MRCRLVLLPPYNKMPWIFGTCQPPSAMFHEFQPQRRSSSTRGNLCTSVYIGKPTEKRLRPQMPQLPTYHWKRRIEGRIFTKKSIKGTKAPSQQPAFFKIEPASLRLTRVTFVDGLGSEKERRHDVRKTMDKVSFLFTGFAMRK
jgi:hypothetical protein